MRRLRRVCPEGGLCLLQVALSEFDCRPPRADWDRQAMASWAPSDRWRVSAQSDLATLSTTMSSCRSYTRTNALDGDLLFSP